MKTKPIIKWPGGKTRLLKHLLPLPPHTCFVEAFAGGAALLLAKQPSPVEVLNDLNGDLINLYRQLKYHAEAVIAELQWMPFSRELMREWIANPGLTEIQRAARWIRCNSISFGGGGRTYAVQKTGNGGFSGHYLAEKCKAFAERMDKVNIENLPYDRLLKNYDSTDTIWFFDPPYTVGETKNYKMWTPRHESLFQIRKSVKRQMDRHHQRHP